MVRIGVSGWSYDAWRGHFYPERLPARERLAWVARRFDTIEANGSFHRLLSPSVYRSWYDAVPRHVRLALKGGRYITHNLKLRNARGALANFFASGILSLREKLGPLLWQLPPRLHFRRDRLEAFLDLLPRDTESAARLAREHDERVADPLVETDARRRLRHVLEPRHASFFTEDAVGLLRAAGVALAVSHAGDWPMCQEVTAGFVYVRLHGAPQTYVSGYAPAELDDWAERIVAWARGGEPRRGRRDVYVYFDNDAAGHAPHDARALAERIGAGGGRRVPSNGGRVTTLPSRSPSRATEVSR